MSSLVEYVRDKYPDDFGWFINGITDVSWNDTVRDLHARMDSMRNDVYVLSMSATDQGVHPKDNMYLWGHYGNGHRGVAIEFDTAEISSNLIAEHKREKGTELSLGEVWAQIIYRRAIDPLTCEHFFRFYENIRTGRTDDKLTSIGKYYADIARMKSDVWQSENEWRLMWSRDDTRLKIHRSPISGNAIKAIFVGLSVSVEIVNDLLFDLKHQFPDAQAFKAKKRFGAFALDFERLS